MKKAKILLTGGAGFIGSNFIKKIACLNRSYDFIVLDALTYSGRFENIQKDIAENEHLSFVKLDLRNAKAIDDLFTAHQFDGVLNFAAETHVDNSIVNPNIFVETNVLGTLNLLNASLKILTQKAIRFLQVSTDEVYGSLKEGDAKFNEKNPIDPHSPYSASKASADHLVSAFNKTYGLDTIITRCSNNYGPYQFAEKLIPLMIHHALNNIKLPIYGDGKNIRDWIYVDDHNFGVWQAFKKGKSGEVYNFGGNAEIRNIDLVQILLKHLQKGQELISYVEDRKGHDFRYAIDYSKAQRELMWNPSVSFDRGIKNTVAWYLQSDFLQNNQRPQKVYAKADAKADR